MNDEDADRITAEIVKLTPKLYAAQLRIIEAAKALSKSASASSADNLFNAVEDLIDLESKS